MKKYRLLTNILASFFFITLQLSAQVGISTDNSQPDPSAGLDVNFSNKGFLPPRLTTAQTYSITNPATGLIVFNQTINKPQYYDGNSWRNFDGTRFIGENFGGGIIFYIDNTGQHGLICAPTDQSGSLQWYNGSMVTTGATGTAVGTGQSNTTLIISVQGAGSYAAELCNDLVLNGYSDWFLPSKDELGLIYTNLFLNGLIGNCFFWTSTETNFDSAWVYNFCNPNHGGPRLEGLWIPCSCSEGILTF